MGVPIRSSTADREARVLRYGMNPHQQQAHVESLVDRWPVRVLSGEPSLINILDALAAWALVREASSACGVPAAASFKHVAPAGAALTGPLDAVAAATFGVDAAQVGALTSAYVRARDADPRASYGDMIAVSQAVDAELADLLRRLPSDGIIAPGFDPDTVAVLAAKKGRRFLVLEADPLAEPPAQESREIGGLRIVTRRDELRLSRDLLHTAAAALPAELVPDTVLTDLLLGLVVLRHTPSNAVAYVRDGMTVGVGAGQQARIDGTRLAGAKTDTWWLRRHPAVQAVEFDAAVRPFDATGWRIRLAEGDLDTRERAHLATVVRGGVVELPAGERAAWLRRLDGVGFVSDGALPFRDNVDQAARHGVRHIAEPGGSVRSGEVEQACREHGIVRLSGMPRLFHH
ncbi:5-aminoimidazole-4-carboxamide ribonucleotide transformylase [Pseudonocardia sp. GCM10023141]|uniref:5-aminoimidazole-4-carboxamide ribonucleotide transformylase n=1 Tax=Pseudonocardia sp. GCM10023141 TaxID=3252653 RepID=UPI00361F9A45